MSRIVLIGTYGRELPEAGVMGIGLATDAIISDKILYAIGSGSLYVADISNPRTPKIIGKITGLGNVRQIAVRDGVAYVTSREDGMFLIDVRWPSTPSILSHYDTVS